MSRHILVCCGPYVGFISQKVCNNKEVPAIQSGSLLSIYIKQGAHALKGNDTFLGEATLIKLFCLLSETGSTLSSKRKEFAHLGANSFLLEQTLFRRGLVHRKANVKS